MLYFLIHYSTLEESFLIWKLAHWFIQFPSPFLNSKFHFPYHSLKIFVSAKNTHTRNADKKLKNVKFSYKWRRSSKEVVRNFILKQQSIDDSPPRPNGVSIFVFPLLSRACDSAQKSASGAGSAHKSFRPIIWPLVQNVHGALWTFAFSGKHKALLVLRHLSSYLLFSLYRLLMLGLNLQALVVVSNVILDFSNMCMFRILVEERSLLFLSGYQARLLFFIESYFQILFWKGFFRYHCHVHKLFWRDQIMNWINSLYYNFKYSLII